MFNLPFYSKEKLIAAFEYGVNLSESAKNGKIILTPEIVKRAEEIVEKEFKKNSVEQLYKDMIPNMLAMFQPKIDI